MVQSETMPNLHLFRLNWVFYFLDRLLQSGGASETMLNKPILHGETILLRPLIPEDAETLFASFADEEGKRLTGTHQTFTLEQVQAHYARVADADDRADYAIVPKDEPDLLLGEVVLNDIDWDNRSAGFRIALVGSHLFGRGYGTQATKLMVQYGFENLNLHRIELEVYDFNPRAIRVYEKAGFVREGVRRDALLWDGTFHDAIVMSILRPEYERMKRGT